MAIQIRRIDYVRENTSEEINMVIDQINRVLIDINIRLNISGVA